MRNSFIISIFLWCLHSCQLKPEKIEYGKEQCRFCSMNIVDRAHAAQYVTKKGKQYKFDAIECMINKLGENEDNISILLVANYGNPGTMLDARTAFYLISDKIRSPMGENLSALFSQSEAQGLVRQYGGKIYGWHKMKQKILNR